MASKGKLKVTCEGADSINYKNILDFQGNLKTIDKKDLDRLKKEILKHGFNSPIHVWKQGEKLHNLDGHQRIVAIASLEADGYEIPSIPVDYILAKNKKQAKHILLSRVKQYGTPNQSGLAEYIRDCGIDIDDIQQSFGDFPNINIEQFAKDFFHPPEKKEAEGSKEISKESFSNLVHVCPKCGFKFGKGVK